MGMVQNACLILMQDRLFEDLNECIESFAIILQEHRSILVRVWDQSFFFRCVCCNSDSTPPPLSVSLFFVDNYWDQLVWKTQSWRRSAEILHVESVQDQQMSADSCTIHLLKGLQLFAKISCVDSATANHVGTLM